MLIQQLREKIRVDGGADVDAIIDEQNEKIKSANIEIDKLTEEKYALEAEYRKLEAEVGPIKYIAEFIYEEADRDVLEEAVRWVIITIIFVFDPLAVLLLIASQYTFEWNRKRKPNVVPDPEPTDPYPSPDEQMQEAMEEQTFEDVDQEAIDLEFTKPKEEMKWEDTAAGSSGLEDPLEEMISKADPEVLEEVKQELEKEVDKTPYDPYTDNRADSELTPQELSQRRNMKLYSPDGRLAGTGKSIKSVTIKTKKD